MKNTEDILSAFRDIIPEGLESWGESDALSKIGPDSLFSEIISVARGTMPDVGAFFLLLFGLAVLIAVAGLIRSPHDGIVSGGVSAVASSAIFLALSPLVSSVVSAIENINSFFSALLPIITSTLLLGGATASAESAAFGIELTLWLTGILSSLFLSPVIAAMLASSSIESLGGIGGKRLARGVKEGFGRLVGISGTVLTGTLALQTYIASAADSVAVRGARYAAGNMIPVVGGAVSGALGTLGGALGTLSASVGVGSVGVILSVSLSPLITLFMYRLCLYFASAFLDFATKGGGVSCISGFMGAIDALIAVYSVTIIVYIIEIVIIFTAGGRVFGAF